MKAARITAVGLVAAVALWIASGHLSPHEAPPAKTPGEQAAAADKPFRVGVLDRGRLVLEAELADLRRPTGRIEVRTPDVARVRVLLDGVVDEYDAERLLVRASDPAALNEQLVRAGIRVTALGVERRSLEQVVLEAATASGDRFGVPS